MSIKVPRLLYITRSEVPSNSAQSKQISSMAQAFKSNSNVDTIFVCGGIGNVNSDFTINGNNNKLLRTIKSIYLTLKLNKKFDVLFTRDIACFACAIFLGKISVYEMHKFPTSTFIAWLIRFLSFFSEFHILSISNGLKKDLVSKLNLFDDRVKVLHDAVSPINSSINDLSENELVLFAKSLKRKGLKIISHTGSLSKGGIDTFGIVSKVFESHGIFLHIGGGEEECDKWNAHYAALGVTNIYFFPQQEHAVARWMQCHSDILFYINSKTSSLYNYTSPLKLYEYFSTGVPVMASIGGATDEIATQDRCTLYREGDHLSIQRAIDEILSSDIPAKKAASVKELTLLEYTWDKRVINIVEWLANK